MNVIRLRTPTKNELLAHIDVLLEQIKAYNSHNHDLKVSKVVLAGKILTSSKLDNTIYLQFKDKNGEVFPPVLALDNALTEKEKVKYLDNENKWFESHNFLVSNYIKIKSLAEKEIAFLKRGEAKIIFSENVMPSPALRYSLNIKKDYFDEKKIDYQLARISKRHKI